MPANLSSLHDPRRHPDRRDVGWKVSADDGAGTNDAPLPDRDSWNQRRPSPDIASFADGHVPRDMVAGRRRTYANLEKLLLLFRHRGPSPQLTGTLVRAVDFPAFPAHLVDACAFFIEQLVAQGKLDDEGLMARSGARVRD